MPVNVGIRPPPNPGTPPQFQIVAPPRVRVVKIGQAIVRLDVVYTPAPTTSTEIVKTRFLRVRIDPIMVIIV